MRNVGGRGRNFACSRETDDGRDISVFKRTRFGGNERFGLEFRTEFFNIFNKTQFAPPNTICCASNNPNFGVVTATAPRPAPTAAASAASRSHQNQHRPAVSWRRPDEGLGHHYLWGLAVGPADPDVMVTSASPSPWAAHNPRQGESSVYRRAAGGGWQEVRDGLPEARGTTSPVLATNPSEPGVFYAACNRGVYRSADAGVSWEQLPLDWPTRYLQHRVNALLIT